VEASSAQVIPKCCRCRNAQYPSHHRGFEELLGLPPRGLAGDPEHLLPNRRSLGRRLPAAFLQLLNDPQSRDNRKNRPQGVNKTLHGASAEGNSGRSSQQTEGQRTDGDARTRHTGNRGATDAEDVPRSAVVPIPPPRLVMCGEELCRLVRFAPIEAAWRYRRSWFKGIRVRHNAVAARL